MPHDQRPPDPSAEMREDETLDQAIQAGRVRQQQIEREALEAGRVWDPILERWIDR